MQTRNQDVLQQIAHFLESPSTEDPADLMGFMRDSPDVLVVIGSEMKPIVRDAETASE